MVVAEVRDFLSYSLECPPHALLLVVFREPPFLWQVRPGCDCYGGKRCKATQTGICQGAWINTVGLEIDKEVLAQETYKAPGQF